MINSERRMGLPQKEFEGRALEEDIFGSADINKQSPHPELEGRRKELLALRKQRHENDPGLGYLDSLELAIIVNCPRQDNKAQQKIAGNIIDAASKKLGLENPEQAEMITTVKTPLDGHGVDGIFVINGIPITVDASLSNKEALGTKKADIWIGDYPPTETATYAIWVLDEAQKIITEYKFPTSLRSGF